MTTQIVSSAIEHLPGRVADPIGLKLDRLATLCSRLAAPNSQGLREALKEASGLDDEAVRQLRELAAEASEDDQRTFLRMLVSAWPNASSGNDLAGYGLQLCADLREQRPTRRALGVAGRQLRRRSKFLPSICEVLEAVEAADKPVVSALRTLEMLPRFVGIAQKKLEENERWLKRRGRYEDD